MCNISCHCAIPGSWFITQCKSTKLLHQPWSYWTYSEAWDAVVVYLFSTLSSIKADPLNRLKHPGLHSTEPNTCSAVFCSQWPTAYSNFWYHTMGPGMADSDRDKCEMRDKLQQWHQKMFETYLLNYYFFFYSVTVKVMEAGVYPVIHWVYNHHLTFGLYKEHANTPVLYMESIYFHSNSFVY